MNDRLRAAIQEVEMMMLDAIPKTRCLGENIQGWNAWQTIIRPALNAIPDPEPKPEKPTAEKKPDEPNKPRT